MKHVFSNTLSGLAVAATLFTLVAGAPQALADSNQLCTNTDPSNCFLAGNFPTAVIQQHGLTPAQAAAIRYVKGDWSIAGRPLGTFGHNGWSPIVGDWDGDGYDNIGIQKNSIWILKRSWDFTITSDIDVYQFGDSTWMPVVGDWNDNGTDSIGLYKNGTFKLQHVSGDVTSEHIINFGNLTFDPTDPLSAWPIVGDFTGSGTRVGIIENTTTAITKFDNQSATYGFDVGDFTNLSAGTLSSRTPGLFPVVYRGFHPTDNPNYPQSKILFALPPADGDLNMCPGNQLCLWLTLSNNGTPNEDSSTEVPEPEVY